MELSSKLPFSFFFIVFLFALITYAQDSPQGYVNAHKAARSQVRVPNLVSDDEVAAFARIYVNQHKADCWLVHSDGGCKYGENLMWSSSDMGEAGAVRLWVDDKAFYNYNNNSCAVR